MKRAFIPLRTVTDQTSTPGTRACEATCPVPEANRRPCPYQRSIDVTRFGDPTPDIRDERDSHRTPCTTASATEPSSACLEH